MATRSKTLGFGDLDSEHEAPSPEALEFFICRRFYDDPDCINFEYDSVAQLCKDKAASQPPDSGGLSADASR
ncbi:hypothetical protein KIPB_013505 [Kipferlia bialata]|uniref:Uncharacterized protein n=1 Tax=Kipferlia bialata TaxID=797122 RepID=A0A391NSI3_9EUKA|nr:hypothetical protein KIPB_013505 [Kipferlia bialata]|eukprot:g13505.t1